ncbi:transcriptional regulator [Arthrobacter sp. MYb227]|uniref:ArsR/SmtB family transcription factor n=1 Tax=Arthrobacter sp. MYb227 TaxID=1848601 RepID=UPI000CFDEEE3|nr:metalloregulator ArsR/SmtB family transcription factor [Arthrobacter sp. MYb227]PQZ91152.1 transcriptional regulator [Arthrobacter sp. MYb227]
MEQLLKAIADPTRAAILDGLLDRDGQTLFEICARLASSGASGASRQAISQHLAVLEGVGLVSTQRLGRYKFHYIDTSPLADIQRRWPQPTTPTEHIRGETL